MRYILSANEGQKKESTYYIVTDQNFHFLKLSQQPNSPKKTHILTKTSYEQRPKKKTENTSKQIKTSIFQKFLGNPNR